MFEESTHEAPSTTSGRPGAFQSVLLSSHGNTCFRVRRVKGRAKGPTKTKSESRESSKVGAAEGSRCGFCSDKRTHQLFLETSLCFEKPGVAGMDAPLLPLDRSLREGRTWGKLLPPRLKRPRGAHRESWHTGVETLQQQPSRGPGPRWEHLN